MTSLFVMCPNPTDATSYYRGMGPLGVLKRESNNLQLAFSAKVDWSVLNMVDAVFMQRPWSPNHLQIAKMVKAEGIPLWVDHDDDLFSVPPDNPTHGHYQDPKNRKAGAEIVAIADIVTVSTGALAQALNPLNKDVRVIPNALENRLIRKRPRDFSDRKPIVLWRGSKTHERDLAFYAEPIIEAAKRNPDWTWHFQAHNPWYITEAIPNSTIGEALGISEYFDFLVNIKPSITIVPLYDSKFNRAKSNIAWIEGTYAGSVCLAPEWEEWRRPGAVTYKDQESFFNSLDALLNQGLDWKSCAEESWIDVLTNYSLNSANQLRAKVISDLTGGKNA